MESISTTDAVKAPMSNIFDQTSQTDHEQVVYCYDKATGLKSIIGIHNTTLGPALGGTRIWQYASESHALNDVLRLSRGMTLKASISGINLGGGKAVIIADENTRRDEAFWRRYGRFVDSLNGKYITAEDVGTSPKDIEYIAMETSHVAGKPKYLGGSGDPSPVTAYGTYLGLKAAFKFRNGSDDISGKTVMVQGVGHVGQYLVKHLIDDGAIVKIADINEDNLKMTADQFKVEVIDPNQVYETDMDAYAPCALGATLNDETIPQLKCSVVAGAANNQLKNERKHGAMLVDRDIVYAPDFLINAGGLINCYSEVKGFDQSASLEMAEKIYDRSLEIFDTAREEGLTPHEAALQLAQHRINKMATLRSRD